jgi:hypothetical protein
MVFLRSVRRLLVTANVVPSSPILVTLMMEELSYSETSVPTTAIRRNIPEDDILHSHRRENLKSYNYPFVLTDVRKSLSVPAEGRATGATVVVRFLAGASNLSVFNCGEIGSGAPFASYETRAVRLVFEDNAAEVSN